MADTSSTNAVNAGMLDLGGDITVHRHGYGRCASPVTGSGMSRRIVTRPRRCCGGPSSSSGTHGTRTLAHQRAARAPAGLEARAAGSGCASNRSRSISSTGADPAVPLEDSIGALAELKDSGKVRHIGVCNVTEAQLKTRACFRNAMDW
jgi:hypothetical protein